MAKFKQSKTTLGRSQTAVMGEDIEGDVEIELELEFDF